MMKHKTLIICTAFLLMACNNKKPEKNELNYISFEVPTDSIKAYMEESIILLDKMDVGNGAFCFWRDGKLHYSSQGRGFKIVDLANITGTFPIVEPLNQAESNRLFYLIQKFQRNEIKSMGKSSNDIYSFDYKQIRLNPYNDFKQSRGLVYLTEDTDTTTGSVKYYFQTHVMLDKYKNILLLAPEGYDEPKLPMDEESIMKRAEEARKEMGNKEDK